MNKWNKNQPLKLYVRILALASFKTRMRGACILCCFLVKQTQCCCWQITFSTWLQNAGTSILIEWHKCTLSRDHFTNVTSHVARHAPVHYDPARAFLELSHQSADSIVCMSQSVFKCFQCHFIIITFRSRISSLSNSTTVQ